MEFGVFGKTEGVEDVGEEVLGALLAKEGDGSVGGGGGEGVVMIPEGVGTVLELFGELGERVMGEFLQCGPRGEKGGQGGYSALGMIGGADAGELPREGARVGVRPVFPPAGPELAQPLMGFGGRAIGEVWGEESCQAKEVAGAIEGGEVAHFCEGGSLGEEGHSELVLMISEGVGEGLPKGLGVAVNVGNAVKEFGLLVGAVEGCFLE